MPLTASLKQTVKIYWYQRKGVRQISQIPYRMGKHLRLFFTGLLVSFIGALPLGVINSTAFQIASQDNTMGAVQFAIVVVIVELIVVRISLTYLSNFHLDNKIYKYLLFMLIAVLLYLAFSNLYSQGADVIVEVGMDMFPMVKSTMLLGFILSALNPLQIPFWIGWNSTLIKRKILIKRSGMYAFYLTGIGFGSMMTLLIFIYAGSYIFSNYTENNRLIHIFMGCLYLGFSIYLLFLFYKSELKLKMYRLFHWEYWGIRAIYYPIFPAWLFFAIKARSFFFFSAANPSIKNGGMAMEPKKEIYDLIPPQYIPKTILVKQDTSLMEILKIMSFKGFTFPLIAKPNIGMKSLGVYIIDNADKLQSYTNRISDDFIIQELISYPKEVSIFYVRFPNEERGRITGIVSKEYLSVFGNGKDSIIQLIKRNPRCHLQLSTLKKNFGTTLNKVLEKNEKFILVPYGSHTRGAKIIDESDRLNEKLESNIDSICNQIAGFYYGRLDIICSSFEDLSDGEKFSIIEINGAGSEPIHMYDSRHSIFFAWKEIIRHWKLLYEISKINNENGHSYMSYKDGTAMLKANNKLEAQLKLI